jgi:hypothetical protein
MSLPKWFASGQNIVSGDAVVPEVGNAMKIASIHQVPSLVRLNSDRCSYCTALVLSLSC